MDDPTIHSMLGIQVRRWPVANEEGASIRIRSAICHRKDSLMRVSNPDLFISKFRPVGAQSIDAVVVVHDFAALHHEARNDALKDPILEMNVTAKFTCAKYPEVLDCPR